MFDTPAPAPPRPAAPRPAPELPTWFHVALIVVAGVSFFAFLAWAGPQARRVAARCEAWREVPAGITDVHPTRECVRWRSETTVDRAPGPARDTTS